MIIDGIEYKRVTAAKGNPCSCCAFSHLNDCNGLTEYCGEIDEFLVKVDKEPKAQAKTGLELLYDELQGRNNHLESLKDTATTSGRIAENMKTIVRVQQLLLDK